MKKNQNPNMSFSTIAKALTTALNSLFFTNNNREFEKLKNFIAS
ncbi:MAG: hypothetical protein WCH52_07520 [Bacteroidota bacterium]|jgi:hypothetical protein